LRTIIRKQTIEAILATDMIRHFDITSALQERIKESENASRDELKLGGSPNDRKLFIQTLLHSVDLGNVTLPFRLCEKWA